jgi:outer membrane receptor protein involved in Fe transport
MRMIRTRSFTLARRAAPAAPPLAVPPLAVAARAIPPRAAPPLAVPPPLARRGLRAGTAAPVARRRIGARVAALVVLAPLAPLPARAQEPADTFALSELVVTATRLPVPRAAVPAAVTVLSGEELRARGVRVVADALRLVPGAAVVRTGSEGGVTSLFLRGGESDYVQVLVDGVVVNDPGGAIDLSSGSRSCAVP